MWTGFNSTSATITLRADIVSNPYSYWEKVKCNCIRLFSCYDKYGLLGVLICNSSVKRFLNVERMCRIDQPWRLLIRVNLYPRPWALWRAPHKLEECTRLSGTIFVNVHTCHTFLWLPSLHKVNMFSSPMTSMKPKLHELLCNYSWASRLNLELCL